MSRRQFLHQLLRSMGLVVAVFCAATNVFSGDQQLDLVPLPPSGPGTQFLFSDGRIPADPGDTEEAALLGAAVPAGDIDGDGMADLFTVVGAGGFPWEGAAVFLLFGDAAMPETVLVRDPSAAVTRIRPAEADHALIRPGLAGVGDLDRDGFDDFLIATPLYSMEKREYASHRIHLFYGSPDLRGTEILLPPEGSRVLTWRSAETLENHGTGAFGVAALGDFDGDGITELAFGASRHDENHGRIYIASLDPELPAGEEMDLAEIGVSLPGYVLEGVSVGDEVTKRYGGDRAGYWVEPAGDLNGDGLDDLYVGYARGLADIVFGARDSARQLRLNELGERGLRLLGPPSGPTPQEFGFLSNAVFPGDLDGDGYDDFVVGTRTGRVAAGQEPVRQVVVVWGRSEFPAVLDLMDPESSELLALMEAKDDLWISGASFGGDSAGSLVAAPGDIDLDGYPDFLVGAPRASRFDRMYSGMVYLIYGGPELRAGPPLRRLPEISGELRASVMVGPYACDVLGQSGMAGAGDFDGDGVPDLAVGATRMGAVCAHWDPSFGPESPRLYLIPGAALRARTFLRGDCNDDGLLQLADAVCTLNWLFIDSETAPGCIALLDTNGDASVDISDPLLVLSYLFLGGPAPVGPYPECGVGSSQADEAIGCNTAPRSCP